MFRVMRLVFIGRVDAVVLKKVGEYFYKLVETKNILNINCKEFHANLTAIINGKEGAKKARNRPPYLL
jgi:hypothetical protein